MSTPQSEQRLSRGRDFLDQLDLREMTIEHLDDISRLHHKELSWSFNGQLGPVHIQKLYKALLSDPHFFGYVVVRNNRLLGFVTATTNSGEMRKKIRGVYERKIVQVALLLLRHPTFLLGVLESLFVVPVAFKRHDTKAEWLTFVTDTEGGYLTPLVAMKLIDAIRDHFRDRGTHTYLAQGVKQNPKAMRLYSKLGWEVTNRLFVHNIYLYRSTAPDAATVLKRK